MEHDTLACLASSGSSWSLLSWRGISRNASDQVSMLAVGQAPISSLVALAPHGLACMSGLSGTTFSHALTLQGPHGKSHAATAMPKHPSPCHAMPPASLKASRFLARARLVRHISTTAIFRSAGCLLDERSTTFMLQETASLRVRQGVLPHASAWEASSCQVRASGSHGASDASMHYPGRCPEGVDGRGDLYPPRPYSFRYKCWPVK